MRFNEKLQYLRKEKKMSQEQLADLLDVTRQSVSKWESGTTYPEMDKLIMLCKIFKCSLDDLTNDEITDFSTDKKNIGSLSINNIVDGFLGFIEKTVKMFQSMNFKECVGCVFSTLILALLLMLVSIPFGIIKDGFNSFVQEIAINGYTNFIMGVFGFIIDVIFVVLYIILLVYIFKIAYLDKYEFVSEKVIEEPYIEKTIREEKKNTKEIKVKSVEEPKENAIFKALGGIVLGFIKFLVVCFSIPVLFILIALCIGLALDIYLIINGITFIGISLLIVLGIIACVWLIEIVSIFLFNRKASFKRLLWTFILGLVGVGLSIGVCLLELSNIDFICELPDNLKYEKTIDLKEYTMSDTLLLKTHLADSVEYIEDDNLGNKVIAELEYYDNFMTVRFTDSGEAISINYLHYGTELNDVKYLTQNFKENLKDKKVYDYDKLHVVNLRIKGSKDNIKRIQENTSNARINDEYNNCENRISEYIDEIEKYESKISILEEEKEELKIKVEELEEYKNRVNELISQ